MQTCQDCGKEYDKWLPTDAIENDRCLVCNEERWKEWECEHAEDYARIAELETAGHPHHCACRQVWGDGQCECDLVKAGYDPYAWQKTLE